MTPAELALTAAASGSFLSALRGLPLSWPRPALGGMRVVNAEVKRRIAVSKNLGKATKVRGDWPVIVGNVPQLAGSTPGQPSADEWSWSLPLELGPGGDLGESAALRHALERTLATNRGAIRLLSARRADQLTVRVMVRDPLRETITWPGPRATTITKPIPVGIRDDGTVIAVPLLHEHLLVSGTKGSGKSGVLNLATAELGNCGDVDLLGIDLKGGVELGPWRPVFTRPPATTITETENLLRYLIGCMEDRYASMAANGIRKWHPEPGAPALVLIIDELANVTASRDAAAMLEDIARRGRAAAVTLVMAVQYPTKQVVPMQVRTNVGAAICLRVTQVDYVDVALGRGAYREGWDASKLDPGREGLMFVRAIGATSPRVCRAYWVSDSAVTRFAARYGKARPQPVMPPVIPGAETDPLLAVVADAGSVGVSWSDVASATGMSRATTYRRLTALEAEEKVVKAARGRWRPM